MKKARQTRFHDTLWMTPVESFRMNQQEMLSNPWQIYRVCYSVFKSLRTCEMLLKDTNFESNYLSFDDCAHMWNVKRFNVFGKPIAVGVHWKSCVCKSSILENFCSTNTLQLRFLVIRLKFITPTLTTKWT